jgi:hypothetical protein
MVKNDAIDSPLFSTSIAIAPVPADPFAGTAIAPFNVNTFLSAGESIRFIVFADGQGQNGTYDGTGLRLTISEVPEPTGYLLAVIGGFGLLFFRSRQIVTRFIYSHRA